MIIFGSVRFLSKKNNKTCFLKNQNQTRTGSNRRFRFGWVILEQKLVWLGYFLSWLGCFPAWLDFFQFNSGFFGFRLIKQKTNQTGQFFQNSNQFFSQFNLFDYFFFLHLINFSVFFPLQFRYPICRLGLPLIFFIKFFFCGVSVLSANTPSS